MWRTSLGPRAGDARRLVTGPEPLHRCPTGSTGRCTPNGHRADTMCRGVARRLTRPPRRGTGGPRDDVSRRHRDAILIHGRDRGPVGNGGRSLTPWRGSRLAPGVSVRAPSTDLSLRRLAVRAGRPRASSPFAGREAVPEGAAVGPDHPAGRVRPGVWRVAHQATASAVRIADAPAEPARAIPGVGGTRDGTVVRAVFSERGSRFRREVCGDSSAYPTGSLLTHWLLSTGTDHGSWSRTMWT
jgi:hypothetical protein